jgi:hypothetical protein
MLHKPVSGEWPVTELYLKHIFGTEKVASGVERWQLGLDYLQLIYIKPTQKLPILSLVSRSKNTGKSTFLWWMREIFGENATVIGNLEFQDKNNDDWATRLIIGVDEGFIHKKEILERIKSQSTNDRINVEGKFKGRIDVGFFGKFIITSNDEDSFINVDTDESRFWVIKVPQFKEENPDILDELKNEIPAFLHYLKGRTLLHPKANRLYFHPTLLESEALNRVKVNSATWLIKELRQIIIEEFYKYEYHELNYTINELALLLNTGTSAAKFRKDDIKTQITREYGQEPKPRRYEFPLLKHERTLSGETTAPRQGRVFTFFATDFMSDEEIREAGILMNPDFIRLEKEKRFTRYQSLSESPTPDEPGNDAQPPY